MTSPQTVTVGVVGKAFGVGGEVYVHPDPDLGETFPAGRTYQASRPGGDPSAMSLTVASSRVHGGRQLVHFEQMRGRADAEALRGVMLSREPAEDDLAADALWVDDLLGLEVVTADGELVGVVADLADGAAHDYLVVARTDGGEVLIPAVDELMAVTDDQVVVTPIPGLLDP